MDEVIVLTRIAMKNTNHTNVNEITRSLFSYFAVKCSLGGILFATDHVLVGARFYSAGQLSTRRGLFIHYRSHYITFPPDFQRFFRRVGNLEDVDECNVSVIRFY